MIDWDNLVIGPLVAIFGEAVPIRYMPASGAPAFDIAGVFDRAYFSVPQLDAVSAASTVKPVLGVRLSQFGALGAADPVTDDLLYVASVDITFIVRNPDPDGHGWAKLELNKVRSGP